MPEANSGSTRGTAHGVSRVRHHDDRDGQRAAALGVAHQPIDCGCGTGRTQDGGKRQDLTPRPLGWRQEARPAPEAPVDDFCGRALATVTDWQYLNLNAISKAQIDQTSCIQCGCRFCSTACRRRWDFSSRCPAASVPTAWRPTRKAAWLCATPGWERRCFSARLANRCIGVRSCADSFITNAAYGGEDRRWLYWHLG